MEKTADMSKTSRVEILFAEHMNGNNRLFGGKLMEWIDIVAAAVARRHSGKQVTTAMVDSLVFKAPATMNDLLLLKGRLVYVGRSSMEVRVDTFVEQPSGERKQINTAYVVLVAIDEDGKSVEVPRLKIENAEDQAEWDAALKRKKQREK